MPVKSKEKTITQLLQDRLTFLKIRKLLHVNGEVDLQKVCKELGVKEFTLYTWRTGKFKPSPFYLAKLSKLLQLNLSETMKFFKMEKV